MTDEIKTKESLDLTGLSCPMPIVKVSKAIKELKAGEVIDALTSDPGALSDFPAWAKTSGNEIIETKTEGKNTRFFIKKNWYSVFPRLLKPDTEISVSGLNLSPPSKYFPVISPGNFFYKPWKKRQKA